MHSAQMQLVATIAPVFQVSMGMDINVKMITSAKATPIIAVTTDSAKTISAPIIARVMMDFTVMDGPAKI